MSTWHEATSAEFPHLNITAMRVSDYEAMIKETIGEEYVLMRSPDGKYELYKQLKNKSLKPVPLTDPLHMDRKEAIAEFFSGSILGYVGKPASRDYILLFDEAEELIIDRKATNGEEVEKKWKDGSLFYQTLYRPIHPDEGV